SGWQIADRADMLLELRGDRALDRPVAAVVNPRRNLVDERTVDVREELDRQNADMVQGLRDPQRSVARLCHLNCDGSGRRRARPPQNAIAMLVLSRVPKRITAVGPARDDDRE